MGSSLIRGRFSWHAPWVHAVGFAVGALLVFVYFYVVLNQSLPTWWTDSYEYAQVGRNLAEGRGLVTFSPHVVEAWLLRAQNLPLPYLLHDPGQALLLGFFFKLFGVNDATVGWATGVWYIMIPPLTYLFARRLFNPAVAAVAGILAIVNNQLIAFGMTGLSEVPYAFFFTCFLYSLYRQTRWWEILISGILFGWLAILRSNALPLFVLCGVFVLLDPPEQVGWQLRKELHELIRSVRAPLLRLALFAVGFALVLLPNAARNESLIKNPLYNAASIYSLIFYTSAFEGKTADFLSMPGVEIDPVSYLAAHPDQLVSKMSYQLSRTLEQLWEGGIDNRFTGIDALLIVLLLIGAVVPRRNENARQRYFRWLIYLAIAGALVIGSMTNLRWRHLYGFIPAILILDAEVLYLGLRAAQTRLNRLTGRQMPFLPIALSIVLVSLSILGLNAAAHASAIGDADNKTYRKVAQWFEKQAPENAIVLAENGVASFGIVSALAWYTGREFVEYSDYTAQTIPAKRGDKPLYLLAISTDATGRDAMLATGVFSDYVEIARLKRANLADAVLFAPPKPSPDQGQP